MNTSPTAASHATEVPTHAQAVVAHGAQDLRVEEVPIAAPKPDEAVIRLSLIHI